MHFLIEDEKLFKKYIWNQVTNSMKKEFHSKPIYNKKFLKTKIKCYRDEATDFHGKEIPKLGYNYTCVTVILTLFLKKMNSIVRKYQVD